MTSLSLVRLWTDWLWFDTVGYQQVMLKVIETKIVLGAVVGGTVFLLMLINLFLADRLSRVGFIQTGENTIELPGLDALGPNMKLIAAAAAAFLSIIIGIEASSRWNLFLQYANAVEFGLQDPVFGMDVSFYVFVLPFFKHLYQWAIMAVVFCAAVSLFVYSVKRGIVVSSEGVHFRSAITGHLSFLGAAILVIKAFGYRIYAYTMLYTSRGFVDGAGYTDINVRLPMLNILFILCLLAAVVFVANVLLRNWRLPAGALAILLLAAGACAAYPEVVQRFRVQPNEISLEKPFIERQIDFTRAAFGLSDVRVELFEADKDLTPGDIHQNDLTINNIRLWDSRPLLQTYQQLQEIRTYYSFANVDIDRYEIGGEMRQVMLSAREISYGKLPSQIWINEHLSFTHGFGLCMSPVHQFTQEGMPLFYIEDIPPEHSTEIKITRPQLYYGELSNKYVFTNTSADEFDYPKGSQNVFANYEGKGGVPLDSLVKKAAFALRFSSLETLLNTDINTGSRVMIYRRIVNSRQQMGRAQRIMPLLGFDSDPYIVVADGELKWIQDAYTLSSTYPYSQHLGEDFSRGINYIRNSVKIVIDAYDGSVDFYVFDPDDPMIKTMMKIFPGVFKPASDMPGSLRRHIRYPTDMFKVQSYIYSLYQMTDPQVFYNKEDLWTYPRELFNQAEQQMEPYYTVMRLPSEEKEEFILMMPFTPVNRDNLSAWMCARNDGKHYGQLLVYRFPKKKLIFGPFQVEARIDQDPEISKQLSLWSQKGSQIIRGNLLVIPIADSLLYVEPLFLKADKGEIPQLKRVIVSTGNRVAMAPNLRLALEELLETSLGEDGSDTELETAGEGAAGEGVPMEARELIRKSLEHLEAAKEKLRSLDWEGFVRDFRLLEETLRTVQKEEETGTATGTVSPGQGGQSRESGAPGTTLPPAVPDVME